MTPSPPNDQPQVPIGERPTLSVPGLAAPASPESVRPPTTASPGLRSTDPDIGLPGDTFHPYRFGDYLVLGRLGSGGMGTVWLARNEWLQREEALKVIKTGHLATPQARQRFLEEMQNNARLRGHPGIVEVYTAGRVGEEPFYTMSLVTGGDLHKLIQETGPQPPRRAAEIVKLVAEAVEYAHQQDIIHRDLKPSNILLTADGTPRVTDFGLAMLMSEDSRPRTGVVEGTPSYMPPEQAEGHSDRIGPRSDVYSLGAILYELLTGQPPFQGGVNTTLDHVRDTTPEPPRIRNPDVPRRLEAICLRCLQKDPQARYTSARQLADALDDFLEPAWRHRMRVTARVLGVLLVVTLCGALWWLYRARQHDQEVAIEQKRTRDLVEQVREKNDLAAVNDAFRVGQERRHGQPREALRLYSNALHALDALLKRPAVFLDPSELRLTRARVLTERGKLRRQMGRPDEAEDDFEKARQELEELQQIAGQDSADLQVILAEVYHNLGILANARNTREQQEKALEHYTRGMKLRKQLLDQDPENDRYRRDLARSYGFMGDTQLELDREEAADSYARARKLRAELAERLRDPESLCQHGRDFGNQAYLQEWKGAYTAALRGELARLQHYRDSKLPPVLPGEFWNDRSDCRLIIAELQLDLLIRPKPDNQPVADVDPLKYVAETEAEYDRLSRKIPEIREVTDFRIGQARIHLARWKHHLLTGKAPRPDTPLEAVRDELEDLRRSGKLVPQHLARLAIVYALLAQVQAANPGNRGYQEALAIDRLQEAVSGRHGFKHLARLKWETGFDALKKSRPAEFNDIIQKMEAMRPNRK